MEFQTSCENGLVRYDFIDSMPHSTPDGGGFVLYGSNLWVSKPWRYCYDGMLVIHLQKRIKYGSNWDESLCDTDPRGFSSIHLETSITFFKTM